MEEKNKKKLKIKKIAGAPKGTVPVYGIKTVNGKKVKYIKYYAEPPGFMGKSKYS